MSGQSQNPWIQFEKEHQGEMSREQLSQAYQHQKAQQQQQGGDQPSGRGGSSGGQHVQPEQLKAWNEFEHEQGGQGLSREQMAQKFHQQQQGGSSGGGSSRGGSSGGQHVQPEQLKAWNEFEHEQGGQGLSREQIAQKFHQQQQGGSSGGSSRGGSSGHGGHQPEQLKAWNEFEHEQGGQGLSREQIAHKFHQQQQGGSSSGGGSSRGGSSGGQQPEQLKAWTEFEHEHGGQGLTRHQMVNEFHRQQQQQ